MPPTFLESELTLSWRWNAAGFLPGRVPCCSKGRHIFPGLPNLQQTPLAWSHLNRGANKLLESPIVHTDGKTSTARDEKSHVINQNWQANWQTEVGFKNSTRSLEISRLLDCILACGIRANASFWYRFLHYFAWHCSFSQSILRSSVLCLHISLA